MPTRVSICSNAQQQIKSIVILNEVSIVEILKLSKNKLRLKKPQIIYTTFGKLLSSDDQLLDYFNSTQDAALNISE
ncbi:hypothetical protein HDU92_007884, partial [Lobulomyces angularis]